MTWVERVKQGVEARVFKRLMATSLTFVSSAAGLMAAARAATTSFIDNGPGRIVPMYGVPATFGPPVVKYGPPPMPTASISPVTHPITAIDWGSMFPSMSIRPSLRFSAPDFGHLMPAFPKLFGLATSDLLSLVAFIAYASLLLAAVCGWALRGSRWYLKNKK